MDDTRVEGADTLKPDLGVPEKLGDHPATPRASGAPVPTTEAIRAVIVEKIRADCATSGAPIHIEDLGTLFPDLPPEQVVDHLAELVKLNANADIHLITSTSGATYLYTEEVLSPEAAAEKILAAETTASIAQAVRVATQKQIRLTALQSVSELAPRVSADKLQGYVHAMPGDERYKDIKQVVGPTGLVYLYSETHMTGNYAALLARAEANDPYMTIAETVREESQLYPRPTKLGLFYEPLFKIPEDQMSVIVESLLKRPEFGDIKKIEAPTGAIYLYSDKYMVAPAAERYVQWEEVERWTSM